MNDGMKVEREAFPDEMRDRIQRIEARSLSLSERAETLQKRATTLRHDVAATMKRVEERVARASAFLNEQALRLGLWPTVRK